MHRITGIIFGIILYAAATVSPAAAQYARVPESYVDPGIFQINEAKHLGARMDRSFAMIDEHGNEFTLGDKLDKPLILVLSYYTCDGSCSVVNADLRDRLAEVSRVKMGKDFEVLTVSFDKDDTPATLAKFRETTKETGDGWTFAIAKDPTAIEAFTNKVGFKYFWSPRDRTFFHPGAFLFLSTEGRLIRVLYSMNIEGDDVELAVLDAKQGQFRPSEIVNFATSLCYSYNYKEGRYTFNIPLIIAVGSLTVGVTAFSGSVFIYRRRKKREGEES